MSRTELLMLTSVVHHCADCGDERLFVAVEIDLGSEFACTDCGAAVMIDPGVRDRARHSRTGTSPDVRVALADFLAAAFLAAAFFGRLLGGRLLGRGLLGG